MMGTVAQTWHLRDVLVSSECHTHASLGCRPKANSLIKVSRTTPSRSHTEAGTLRKRAQRACTECHSHKTRCSGDYPRCKRCEASNLVCEYTPAKRKFQHVPASAETLSDSFGSVYSYGSARSSTVGDTQSVGNGDTNNAGTPAIALPDLTTLVKE